MLIINSLLLKKLAEFFTRNSNINDNRIIGVANPIDSQDVATKLYVDTLRPTYDVYKIYFSNDNRTVQITHLGGKNVCTLDGNIIRLSDVSSVIRVNISGFGSNTAGAMSVKVLSFKWEQMH